MTASEQAKIIIEKFLTIEKDFNKDLFCDECGIDEEAAKCCALITVDFYLKEHEEWSTSVCCGEDFNYRFWKEVKKEIELFSYGEQNSI